MEANLIPFPMKLKLQVEDFEIAGPGQMLRFAIFNLNLMALWPQKFESGLLKKNSAPNSEDFVNQLVDWMSWLLSFRLIFEGLWLHRLTPEA